MKTELFTVSKIFTETLFRIPDYQRGYAWQTEQLKDFWLDLEQLNGEEMHYTGVLTLEAAPEASWSAWEDDRWIIKSRRYKPYYVVDGQQRLTTVVILLTAIIEACKNKQLNFTPIDDIRRKYIFDSKLETSSRSYIFGYEKDNPSYEFLKKKIFLENSDHHAPDEDTIYTKNLIAAKMFFVEQLKDVTHAKLEKIYTKVTQQFVFNAYEISSEIDVCVTFETMNNRGKPLSSLELLKNRLIFLSTKLATGENGGGSLRRAINDAWKTTYHFLGKNDERALSDDEFLRTHLSYFYVTELVKFPDANDELHRDKAFRRFVHTLEESGRFLLNDLFTPKRLGGKVNDDLPPISRNFIYDFSQHIKSSIETYYNLSTPKQSTFTEEEKIQLERIGRLKGFNPSSILLAVYSKESDSRKRLLFLEQFERYNFCMSMGIVAMQMRRGPLPNFFVDYTSGKKTIEDITVILANGIEETLRETPLPDMLHDWVKNGHGYYGWRSINYFLYEYEVHLQTQSKSNREKISWAEFSAEDYSDDYETIEHIYPQRARDPYWKERFSKYSTTEKRAIRNSFGNLLALSRRRNSSLGNKSFTDKLGDESSKTGYRYGSYSENEVALLKDWNADEIVNRGVKLLNFLEKRWKLTIGDRNQKIRALGLSFLYNKYPQG
ncbi:MAG: DUF262 domain-containing protein [Bdellovibrionia bacterium]